MTAEPLGCAFIFLSLPKLAAPGRGVKAYPQGSNPSSTDHCADLPVLPGERTQVFDPLGNELPPAHHQRVKFKLSPSFVNSNKGLNFLFN